MHLVHSIMIKISNLPTELLIRIFQFYIYSYDVRSLLETVACSYSASALHNLLLVCRYWHTTVISNSSLWGILDLRSDARVAKMLEISGQAPLIIRSHSTPFGDDTDTEWEDRVKSIMEGHLGRVQRLRLSGPSDSIRFGLENTGSTASLLCSLHLAGEGASTSLPSAVQNWIAPHLEDLLLHRFSISWNSALLQSCRQHLLHLCISLGFESDRHFVAPPQQYPTLQQLATQLIHMKLLRSLSLVGGLRLVVAEQFHSTPIRLPNLAQLDLLGSVTQCRAVWDMLDLPYGCKITLCCDFNDPSSAIPELFPHMERLLCRAKDEGDLEIVRHLSVAGHHGQLTCEFWMQVPPDSHLPLPSSKPDLTIRLGRNVFPRRDAVAMLLPLTPFLTTHIIPQLRSLHLIGLPGPRHGEELHPGLLRWTNLLGGATPKLAYLTFQNISLRHIVALLSTSTALGSVTVASYACAALEKIEMKDTEFEGGGFGFGPPQEQDDGAFSALKQCLHARVQAHAGPNVLHITGQCHSMTSIRHMELKEVVPTVIWEPPVEGSSPDR